MAFEIIEHLDPTGKVMVARVPQEGSGDFTTGSQLVVQDTQIAVFYRDGVMADQFRAGRYTLSTENLPIIKSMTKLAFHGKSPFRAYVYFVNQKVFIDIGWGTPEPILFRDSELRMVNLRGHGTFAIRISDHVRFLSTLVGTKGLEDTYSIEEYLRKLVVARFAKTLPEVLTTVIDLAARYQDIEVKVKAATHEDLAQYGLELVDLVINSITMPPEVQQIIDRAAGTRSMAEGEISRYQQVAAADALLRSSEGGGGGELAAGLGIGAGLAMGQQFAANVYQDSKGQQPGGQAPPPLPQGKQWYAGIEGQRVGPMGVDQLQAYIREGKITPESLVWTQGMDNWAQAREMDDLAGLFGSEPPDLPPLPG